MVELLQKHLGIFENALAFLEFLRLSRSSAIGTTTFLQASRVDQGLILSKGSQLIIIVVSIEKRLHTISSEICHVLFEFWIFEVLPFFVNIFLIKVVLHWRDERSSHPLFVEVLPRKICHPRVVLDLIGAVGTKSILWFSLNHFIDEVCGLNRPSPRHFALFDLNLFAQNVVPDFFAGFSDVGPSTVHALVGHNSNGEIIDRSCMVLTAHNFWSHVTWRTGSVLRVLRPPNSSNTEISYSYVAIIVDHKILRLDISVDDLLLVAVFQTGYKTSNEEPCIKNRI